LTAKTGPKLPSKKNWRTYRRWKGWSESPEAWYVDDTKPKRKPRKNGH